MNDAAIDTYLDLMREVKHRIEFIDMVLAGDLNVRAKIAEESCYLQLRMIAEIIAVGCLVIHDELKPSASLLKMYEADKIISKLEGMHPDFFPKALENEDSPKGEFVYKKSAFLTKEGLKTLWHEAGGILHKGSAKNILKREGALKIDKIKSWKDRIVELLNRHLLITPEEDRLIVFGMNNGQGEVHFGLFKRFEGGEPIDPA